MSKLAIDKLLEAQVPLTVPFKFTGNLAEQLRIIYPELESELFITLFSFEQRQHLDNLLPSSPEKPVPKDYFLRAIKFAFLDSENNPAFTDEDIQIMGSKPDALISALSNAALAHNRLTHIEKVKTVKNSKRQQRSKK